MNRKNAIIILCLFAFMLNVNAEFITILDANFQDGSLAGWDVNSGTWSASNLDLNGAFLDKGSISRSLIIPTGADFQIHYTARINTSGLNTEFFFLTDQNGIENLNGYELLLQNATTLFRKRVNGAPTSLITSAGVSLDVNHTVDINKTGTTYNVYIDGTSIGSIIDTTYSSGTKIVFATENGPSASAFDNVIVRSNAIGSYATITVLRPINEKTFASIDGNWSAELTNGSGASYQNGNEAQKIFIGLKSDTNYNNFVIDDTNGGVDNYFPRSYVVYISLTDSNSYILQPYLIPTADGVPVNITVKNNAIGNDTIPGIRLKMGRAINGNERIVEDSLTNFAGVSQFTLIHQYPYTITATNLSGSIVYFPLNGTSNIFTDTSSEFTMFIDYTDQNNILNRNNYDINILPNVDFLSGTSATIDINVDVNFSFTRIVVEALDQNVVEATASSVVSPFTGQFILNLTNFDSNQVTIHVQIQLPDENIDYYRSYFVTNTNSIIVESFRNLRNYLGPTSLLMIVFFALIMSFRFIGESPIGNNESRVILFVIILGFFVWLWWFDNYWIIMSFIGAILGTLALYLYSKNRGS